MKPQLISSSTIDATTLAGLLTKAQRYCQAVEHGEKTYSVLNGKTVALLFCEPSTRTRCSFELAARYLGAHVLVVDVAGSSLRKGETLFDTVENLLQLGVDAFVVRHEEEGIHGGLVEQFGEQTAFLNAGEGRCDHPTQALLDTLTLVQEVGNLQALSNKKLLLVGDIRHSRVAMAHLKLWSRLREEGLALKLSVSGPPSLLDPDMSHRFACSIQPVLPKAVEGADFVMALRLQKERQKEGLLANLQEYIQHYQVNEALLAAHGKPTVKVLHPGPVNRGIEISSSLVDDPDRSLILQQVRNGLAMRMACLEAVLID